MRWRSPAPASAARCARDGVGFVNVAAALSIVVGTPLVGLTFSLPGDGRLGFVVLGVLAALAAVATPPWRWPKTRDSHSAMLAPMLSFGVTVLPDPPYSRFLELIKLAE